MAHGVHPAVKGEQAAPADQVIDLIARESGPQQLPPRHDPVLRARDPGRNPKWGPFAGYRPVNGPHPARIAPPASPLNAQMQQNGTETPPSLPSRR